MNGAKLVLTAALLAAVVLLVAGALSASAVGGAAGPAGAAGAAGEKPTSAAGPPAEQNPAGALADTPGPPAPQQTPTPTACVPGQLGYQASVTIGNIITGTTDIGNHCDDCTTTIALPFPVRLYEQTYNGVNLSSNGNAQFASSDAAFANACLPAAPFNFAIYPYWDDLNTANAGYGIFTVVLGSAPNRTFVIEWRAQYFSGGGTAHFNLLLHENSPDFEVIYGTVSQGNASATVGVQRDTGSRFTQYACDGSGGPVAAGVRINFTLPTCGTPTPTATVCPPSGTPGPWRTATPGPPTRYRAGGTSDGVFVYVYGGGNATSGNFLNDLWRWDPATETWMQLANMPTGKQNIQGSYWNGKLYVPGGFSTGAVHITEMAIYDIASNSWFLGTPLPVARSAATAAHNNRIYLFGGNPGPTNTTAYYDIAANSWFTAAPMPVAVTYGRALAVGGYAYYTGGIPGSGVTNAVNRYDFAGNSWTPMASLNSARSGHELMSDGTYLFAVNGAGVGIFTGLPPAETFEIYTIATNSWVYGSPTIQTSSSPAGGYARNKLMIQGGVNGATYYDLVQVAVQPGRCPTATPTPQVPTATPTGGPQYRLYLPANFRNAATP